ncbi:hypothetical protein CEXT_659911 [Caerostris extrusa]|uniref:Uncharacterized protein n=1 Tax=Caerostris extrusa TaxID=172846 RepID=A0AAV4MAW9_CAEEX|nr:hypothetical protein CEXT_659911 [Caerostris extrusa]
MMTLFTRIFKFLFKESQRYHRGGDLICAADDRALLFLNNGELQFIFLLVMTPQEALDVSITSPDICNWSTLDDIYSAHFTYFDSKTFCWSKDRDNTAQFLEF